MTFVEIYGIKLDRELGSADRVNLFTLKRRREAVNEAQTWFVTQTGCLTKTAAIPLVHATAEYDVEAAVLDDDFLQLAKPGPEVVQTTATGTVRTYAGPTLTRTSVERLNAEDPDWRTLAASVPTAWYERDEGGAVFVGLTPAPKIVAPETWILRLPYVVLPAPMVGDLDEPFTVDGNPKVSLTPWHDALVYYAASELEKLRKGLERSIFFRQAAEARILDHMDKVRVPGGKTVRIARNYRRPSGYETGAAGAADPWR